MPFGLPHYKNSKASMDAFEPVYQNLFELRITPPAAIRKGTPWENADLILDNKVRIRGLANIEKAPGVVEQIYKGATRSYSAGYVDKTSADIELDFNVNVDDTNSVYVYKALRAWSDLIYNPQTGSMSTKSIYAGKGTDATSMTVFVYNRNNIVIRQITFYQIFPIAPITGLNLDYTPPGNEIYKIEGWKLRADYWDDVTR